MEYTLIQISIRREFDNITYKIYYMKILVRILALIVFIVFGLILYDYYRTSGIYSTEYFSEDYIPHESPLGLNSISIINLIANPQEYDGERIQVSGVVRLDVKDKAVFLSSEDYRNHVFKNAIEIVLPRDLFVERKKDLSAFSGRHVMIDGFFKADTGRWGLYSGVIYNVQSIRFSILEGAH